jgi:ATP-dependent helicase/nuclease subunit A
MPQLTVYKASAGSGKTFRLTVEYLKLLLKDPESYRHILAVTFTNKATAEMKERVLSALDELMHLDPSNPLKGMPATVCQELGMTPEQAKDRATQAIGSLLHDYGRFRIETIDSFFQSILRNLARELGLGAWLNIELNNDKVLGEAVDALIDSADTNPELLQWMTDYIEELLQEGKSWKIEGELKEFGKNIFKEYFKEKERALKDKLSDKTFLKEYKKLLKGIEREGLDKLVKATEPFFKILSDNGLSVDDFSRNKTGPCSYFLKLQREECGEEIFLQSYVQAALEDPSKWSTKTSKLNGKITELAASQLNPLLVETEQLRKKLYTDIVSVRLAVRHLNQVGLLTDISAEVNKQNLENNRFLLSNTNALLKSLLEGSDASFVYEKTGTEIFNILFDEFQDTSRMQWDTFKPLLQEGLANGNDSLIVGDEKQSIYRWRNGDWRILGNIPAEMAPALVVEKSLTSNWRSERTIVEFNNTLFAKLENTLNDMHIDKFHANSPELQKAYSDVVQHPERQEECGLVNISFLSTKNNGSYRSMVLSRMIREVEELQRAGVRPDQIAILIRVNKEIPEIGEYFAAFKASRKSDPNLCYDIVSDEAFLLRSSKAVQIIMDALRLLNDPVNPIAQSLLKLDYQTDVELFSGSMHPLFRQNRQNRQTAERQPSGKTNYKKLYVDSNPEEGLLPEEFTDRFEALQRLPLYELVEELFRIFRLQEIPAQDSYLHCFMDKLSEYLLHAPADVASFLAHWDEDMAETSIPAGSAINGIRILSIHKSKGLEFHTVLIPFCDWKLLNSRPEKVWCQPTKAPYNQLDLLPIDYGTEMGESIFAGEYVEETLQLWVDALNLLYVGFTRAKHNLYAFCRGNDTIKDYKGPTTISNLLQDALKAGLENLPGSSYTPAAPISFEPLLTAPSNGEEGSDEDSEEEETLLEARYQIGAFSLGTGKKEDKDKGSDISLSFRSFAHKTKFRQSNRSREFCKGRDPEGFSSSYIDRGNLLHRLFQDVRQKEDVLPALQSMINEGLLTTEEAAVYGNYAEKALSLPEVAEWYSNRYKLFSECSILSPGSNGKLQLKRPDRVMLEGNDVQVVDFKFGKPAPSHRKQVQEYMQLLTGMGHTNVKGFLWYVDENRVEVV